MTGSSTPTTMAAHSDDELRQTMGIGSLIVYGLVFIGPAAAVGIFGPLFARSNGAVPLVYLVATLAMSFTAFSYAQLSSVIPRAGSVFAYATAGIGPRTGFIAGWMVMLDYLLIPSVAYLFTGIAMHSIVPMVPTWAWTAIAVLLTTGLNLAGVKTAVRAAALVVAAEVLALTLVLIGGVIVLAKQGPARGWLTPLIGVGDFSLVAILGAVSVALLSYLGFDAIATFAEEAHGDAGMIGRAILICLAIAGLLFAAQTYIGALIMPDSPATLAAHPELQNPAFYTLVNEEIAPWLGGLLAASKAVGAAFSAMVGQAAASRILLDMGRESRMPRFLAKVSSTGVPLTGILAAALGNVAIAIWAALQPGGLDHLVSLVTVGALSAFILLHASVVGYFFVRGERARRRMWRHLLAPIIGALILIIVLALASRPAQVIGGIWLLVGIIVVLSQQRRRTT